MIPFLDLKKINQPYKTAFQEKLKLVLDNGCYILGNEVLALVRGFRIFNELENSSYTRL